jgi:hypothetical protein
MVLRPRGCSPPMRSLSPESSFEVERRRRLARLRSATDHECTGRCDALMQHADLAHQREHDDGERRDDDPQDDDGDAERVHDQCGFTGIVCSMRAVWPMPSMVRSSWPDAAS